MELINKKIKSVRTWTGKTQQDFANSINVSRSTLALIETGKAVPTYEMLKLVSQTYGIPSTYFFEEMTEDIEEYIKNNPIDLNTNNEVKKHTLSKHVPDLKPLYKQHYQSRLGQTLELLRQSKRILDIRLKKELNQSHKEILDAQNVLDEAYAVVDVLHDVFINYVASPPDPSSLEYYTTENAESYEVELPDKIDYKKYKEDVVEYYTNLLPYLKPVSKLRDQIEAFLSQIKKIDEFELIS